MAKPKKSEKRKQASHKKKKKKKVVVESADSESDSSSSSSSSSSDSYSKPPVKKRKKPKLVPKKESSKRKKKTVKKKPVKKPKREAESSSSSSDSDSDSDSDTSSSEERQKKKKRKKSKDAKPPPPPPPTPVPVPVPKLAESPKESIGVEASPSSSAQPQCAPGSTTESTISVPKEKWEEFMDLLKKSQTKIETLEKKISDGQAAANSSSLPTSRELFSTPVITRSNSRNSDRQSLDLDQSMESTPLSSSYDSVLGSTPGSGSVTGRRGRGRPRKELVDPRNEKPPENLSKSELQMWNKRHKTKVWRYNQLVSAEAEQFRRKESDRISKYQHPKYAEDEDDDDDDDLDGVEAFEEDTDNASSKVAAKKKEQSRLSSNGNGKPSKKGQAKRPEQSKPKEKPAASKPQAPSKSSKPKKRKTKPRKPAATKPAKPKGRKIQRATGPNLVQAAKESVKEEPPDTFDDPEPLGSNPPKPARRQTARRGKPIRGSHGRGRGGAFNATLRELKKPDPEVREPEIPKKDSKNVDADKTDLETVINDGIVTDWIGNTDVTSEKNSQRYPSEETVTPKENIETHQTLEDRQKLDNQVRALVDSAEFAADRKERIANLKAIISMLQVKQVEATKAPVVEVKVGNGGEHVKVTALVDSPEKEEVSSSQKSPDSDGFVKDGGLDPKETVDLTGTSVDGESPAAAKFVKDGGLAPKETVDLTGPSVDGESPAADIDCTNARNGVVVISGSVKEQSSEQDVTLEPPVDSLVADKSAETPEKDSNKSDSPVAERSVETPEKDSNKSDSPVAERSVETPEKDSNKSDIQVADKSVETPEKDSNKCDSPVAERSLEPLVESSAKSDSLVAEESQVTPEKAESAGSQENSNKSDSLVAEESQVTPEKAESAESPQENSNKSDSPVAEESLEHPVEGSGKSDTSLGEESTEITGKDSSNSDSSKVAASPEITNPEQLRISDSSVVAESKSAKKTDSNSETHFKALGLKKVSPSKVKDEDQFVKSEKRPCVALKKLTDAEISPEKKSQISLDSTVDSLDSYAILPSNTENVKSSGQDNGSESESDPDTTPPQSQMKRKNYKEKEFAAADFSEDHSEEEFDSAELVNLAKYQPLTSDISDAAEPDEELQDTEDGNGTHSGEQKDADMSSKGTGGEDSSDTELESSESDIDESELLAKWSAVKPGSMLKCGYKVGSYLMLKICQLYYPAEVLGEYKRRNKAETKEHLYELGCRLYEPAKRRDPGTRVRVTDEDTRHWLGPYKLDKVWLVKLSDVIKPLNLKKEEKLTASRTIYYFIDPKFDNK